MPKKFHLLLAAALLGAGPVLLPAATPVAEDFNRAVLPAAADSPGGVWSGLDNHNFQLVPDPVDPAGKVLRITRRTPGILSVRTANPTPPERNTVFSFRARPGKTDESTCAIRFLNRKDNAVVATVLFDRDNVIAATVRGSGHFALRSVPENWQSCRIEFKPGSPTFEIYRQLEDGRWLKGNPVPFENNLPVDQVEFITVPAASGSLNECHIDDIRLGIEDSSSLAGRDNVLSSANDCVAAAEGKAAGKLIDGDVSGESQCVLTLPAVMEFALPAATLVSSFRLFSGNVDYAANPSGEMSAVEYKLEALSAASGQYREIARRDHVPGVKKGAVPGNADFFDQFDFAPLEVSGLRLTILDSNDTGKRADVNARPAKSVIVREAELYTRDAAAGNRRSLGQVLAAEFRLPVYRDQKEAQLIAVLPADAEPLTVEIGVKERHTGAIPMESFRVTLQPGENRVPLAIADWPNGEYRTLLRSAGSAAPVRGEFARLLRIDRIPSFVPGNAAVAMTGKRMFFPDDRYLAKVDDLAFGVEPPAALPVGKPFLAKDEMIQLGSGIGFDAEGRLVVEFNSMNREWAPESLKTRHAVRRSDGGWEIVPGHAPQLGGIDQTRQRAHKLSGGGATIGYSFGSKHAVRFYDPAQDGPVKLDELVVQYVGYKPVDWGVIKPQPQSTWVMWPRNGELLLLSRKPFLVDNIASEEFEDPTNSNDNFAGQWLSPDKKTFFYVRGRLLKRYPPFIARYDNLWQIARILTVFSTQDGLNWEQHYFALPDENDPPTAQHYGASIFDAADGNGLMFAYAMPYSALHQQYHCELYYSWDGRAWRRLAGHRPWIPPGKPGDWNFGLVNIHNNIAEKDGKLYELIGWAAMGPHFSGDVLYSQKLTDELDGAALEKRYGKRDMANWPYFKEYYGGDYGKLAAALKEYGSTPGVMVYRVNGYCPLSASADAVGTLITRPVTAGGGMRANLKVASGGYAEFRLRDAATGAPLPGYEKRFEAVDAVSQPIFEQLPATPFQVECAMKNGKLYTLDF